MSQIAERIEQRLDQLGKNPREVALAIGTNNNLVYDILKGKVKSPRMATLQSIARELHTSVAWLMTGEGDGSDGTVRGSSDDGEATVKAVGERKPGRHPASARANVDLKSIRTDGLVGERDFPIYSSSQGGATGMIVSYDPIEWVRRPEPLFNVKGGFGMYVVGDSMDPVFVQGDTLLVHPIKPPQRGDDVLIVLTDDGGSSHAAMVKRLISYDNQSVRLKQYNPPDEFEISREKIHSMQLIVGSYKRR